jgi:hypothetical protein
MTRRRENEEPKPARRISSAEDDSREARLDEALEDTFPASDPVSVEHSEHAGLPPDHGGTAKDRTSPDRKRD